MFIALQPRFIVNPDSAQNNLHDVLQKSAFTGTEQWYTILIPLLFVALRDFKRQLHPDGLTISPVGWS